LKTLQKLYSLPITATTTTLDTLFWGLQPNELEVVISPDHYKLWTKRERICNASLEKALLVSFKQKHLKPIHRK
jgi:hypothetical protein